MMGQKQGNKCVEALHASVYASNISETQARCSYFLVWRDLSIKLYFKICNEKQKQWARCAGKAVIKSTATIICAFLF